MSLTLVPPVAEALIVVVIFALFWYFAFGALNWMFAGAYSILDKQEDYAARLEHKTTTAA